MTAVSSSTERNASQASYAANYASRVVLLTFDLVHLKIVEFGIACFHPVGFAIVSTGLTGSIYFSQQRDCGQWTLVDIVLDNADFWTMQKILITQRMAWCEFPAGNPAVASSRRVILPLRVFGG